ncbi:STAS domain-containing protein [Mesobacillus jeotgali]|uniref:STAS domain-containing protein n=1 Tax=Mesobacillus jeotgali TaxID=129985 RepID=UPI0009A71AB7|nr:STAS domain-containing protein [Mesobacillus jeotgali]
MEIIFKQLLMEREEHLIKKIIDKIHKNQPETFLKLALETKREKYIEQMRKLFHLLEKAVMGESAEEEILGWGRSISEDKVRQGLSLTQSISHFHIVRSVLCDELISIVEGDAKQSVAENLMLGKVINEFIDDIILIFSASFTGMANKRLKAQQEVIDELSTPVISIVDGVAVLPIIGDIDTHRARILMEHTLKETIRQEVECLIMDLSGVFIVDTMVAQELFKIIDSLRLTGVDVNLTGMRPELAHSVVTLGINFDNVKMYNNLGQALKAFGIVRK